MTKLSYRSSRPDSWTLPRQSQPDWKRRHAHGPIQPMEQQGFFARLFKQASAK